jgi:hypothetical protein
MNGVATLARSIWQRNGRGLLVIAAYFAIFCVGIARFANAEGPRAAIFGIGSLLLIICYLALIGIFMYQDSDVGIRGSAYPTHMLTLPLRTYKLVFLPMFLGTIAFVATGLIISKTIHAYYDLFPLYWPTFLITAILAMLQALFWYPLGIPYSKLVLTLVGIPTMVYIVSANLEAKVSQSFVCECLALVTLVSYSVAYQGVVRARRGELQMFSINIPITKSPSKKEIKWLSFQDKFAAQRWYEWRQQGLILPCLVLFLCILFFIPSYWRGTESIVYGLGDGANGTLPMVETFVYTYLPLVVFIVPVSALIVGCGARRTDIKHSDRTFQLFFGTRPMADGALVAQKLWLALKSSIVALCIVLGLILTLLPRTGGIYHTNTQIITNDRIPIFELLKPYMTLNMVVWLCCATVLVVTVTWRNYAIGFWTELSGKTWLRYGYPITMLLFIFGVPSAFGRLRAESATLLYEITFGLIWALVVFRIIAAGILVRDQLRNGIMTRQSFQRGLAAYSVGYITLIPMALVCTVTFRESFSEYVFHSPLLTNLFVIGLTLLWIPIVRLLLATQMLHNNRHRTN